MCSRKQPTCQRVNAHTSTHGNVAAGLIERGSRASHPTYHSKAPPKRLFETVSYKPYALPNRGQVRRHAFASSGYKAFGHLISPEESIEGRVVIELTAAQFQSH